MRPGLSGWAQVCGGKQISTDEKVALDEWYIRHASAWRDICIVVRTVGMLLFTGDRRDEKAITAALRERQSASAVQPTAAAEMSNKKYDAAVTQPALEEVAGPLAI